MKILACVLLFMGMQIQAATIQLETPYLVDLNPIVSLPRCYAAQATTSAYKTVVTGFSSDENYVLGQVTSKFTCGSSGRGGTLHTVTLCTHLTWDLSGNLVSVNTASFGIADSICPTVPVLLPPTTPPAQSVIGNEFVNSGGAIAETVIAEGCGSIACFATYYYPTLETL